MTEKYFLGAVCGGDFTTSFADFINSGECFTYILKGGAGTGKSSLMKKIAEHFEPGRKVVRYYCSSDPDSLDAVVIPELHAAVCDGTSPHVFEPKYPGVRQRYIDLGEFWDKEKLDLNTTGITAASDLNKSLLDSSKRMNKAAFEVMNDILRIGRLCLLPDKIGDVSNRLISELITGNERGIGSILTRRLTALTGNGQMTFTETLRQYETVYYLADDHFAAADFLLKTLSKAAAEAGETVIISPAQMLENAYQHLLLPELGTAFVSGMEPDPSWKVIDLTAKYDESKITNYCDVFEADKRLANLLIEQTAQLLRKAKYIHDELESYYIGAMDFAAVDKLTEKLISEIEM